MQIEVVILAAGRGKRMYSDIPKVLHSVGGKPMLQHVIETAKAISPQEIHVIYGHQGDRIREALASQPVHWIQQAQTLGTGHAVLQALPHIHKDSFVLILSGDVPLIEPETLTELIDATQMLPQSMGILVATYHNPTGLGRVIRHVGGTIERIVEEKDASPTERLIQEIYTGICCVRAADLQRWLPKLNKDNHQQEYYLTDIIQLASQEQTPIIGVTTPFPETTLGVNTRLQLHNAERTYQQRLAEKCLSAGVNIADIQRLDIRGEFSYEENVFIDINVIIEGKVHLGKGCHIGAHSILRNTTLGANTHVHPHSIIDGCETANDCQIGPFARIRPGTRLGAHCKIGNFMETKNAVFAEHVKASHLSYLGDVTIGNDVNIGAGTITCNYDGQNKYPTIIEEGAFIGSGTQLVAPVSIGRHAVIGAGTTLRKNAPADALTYSVKEQKTHLNWKKKQCNKVD
ncbi:MAG: bifunctional UDP-N-acetylglucosamine diphosphorylase/glucosamine-1-phosphate N-acetyltransferase GlmU [Legionellaceae bacterium]|nr:bifunctional UDP-N-acetylglucosamine diphosphorylase/glucosamine-1-phosphate N-acetyltransferase GlmU [Legionellaceae bacterium]